MIEFLALVCAAQALIVAAVLFWTHIGSRATRRAMRAQYPGREFSPAWTNRDGRRWRYCLRSGRIVSAV